MTAPRTAAGLTKLAAIADPAPKEVMDARRPEGDPDAAASQ